MPLGVRQGDPSNHGGTVVSGCGKVLIVGQPAARLGDAHSCPVPNHGTTSIVSASSKVTICGSPAARQGDVAACGASLAAGQPKVVIG